MKKPKPIRRRRPCRKGPFRSPVYRRWISRFDCVVCHQYTEPESGHNHYSAVSQAAHTGRTNGMASKSADSTCIPLCVFHHNWYDGREKAPGEGVADIEEFHQMDFAEIAASFFARWKEETA